MRIQYIAWVCVVIFVAGCGSDDGPSTPGPVSEQLTWIGSFTGGGVRGAVSLDLVKTEEKIAGNMVVTRVPELKAPELLLVSGTLENGNLHLELDSSRVFYGFTMTIDAVVDTSLVLAGTIEYPLAGVDDSFAARILPEESVTLLGTLLVPATVRAMVWDGTRIWLSTLNDDYLRITSDGGFIDQVTVLYNGAHWTSNALTYDGTNLLGFLPITVIGPGGTVNGSKIIEFDQGGIERSYEITHRTDGLAYDGTRPWSLDVLDRSLAAFDASGTITDRVSIDVPDPYHLEFDGGYFWTVSWYTLRLFKVGTDGRAVSVIDVPLSSSSPYQAGLAVSEGRIWYGQEISIEQTRIYRFQIE